MRSLEWKLKRAELINKVLKHEFPVVASSLEHKTAEELLFATILSAQCTDERVNMTTRKLFVKYKSVHDFAVTDLAELTKDVSSINFFKNKAKYIQQSAQILESNHNGKVPDNLDALIKLPGVGRKTANVVLGDWFKKPAGIVVDTHVLRTAYRTELTDSKDPKKVEAELMQLFPREDWAAISLRMIFHGRTTCKASRKASMSCSLGELCTRL